MGGGDGGLRKRKVEKREALARVLRKQKRKKGGMDILPTTSKSAGGPWGEGHSLHGHVANSGRGNHQIFFTRHILLGNAELVSLQLTFV